MTLDEAIPRWIQEIPNHLKTQEMCDAAVGMEPGSLTCVPDCLKTQEMCNDAVPTYPYLLDYVP